MQVAPLHICWLCPDAIVPQRATKGTISYNLHATTPVTIPPATRTLVPTSISIETPDNTYGRITLHSGLASKANVNIGARVINPDYRGELKVLMINNSNKPHKVHSGDCIAQLILEGAQTPLIVVTDSLSTTIRGQAGFGLTDMTPELAEIFEVTLSHTASTKLASKEEQYTELHKQVPVEYHDYLDIFNANLAMLACPPNCLDYDFKINLQENAKLLAPHRPYQLSRDEDRIMKEWLDSMLAMGMISHCTTRCPTTAPIFFVRKKDSTKCPVINYHHLNDITIRDSYPLPCINQIMDQVHNSKYFSKFNMKSGYNQLCIHPGDEWKTAFVTPHGMFQLNVMTFGFMNAPLAFQWFVNDLLYCHPELINNLVGYLDDANTHNKTMPKHITTNQAFLQHCCEAGVTLNPKKCKFHKTKVDFLGVELSADGFEMECIKVNAICSWKPPCNVKGVREFIGFCNFYCRFVCNFVEVAQPLHDLTKQNTKWEWGTRQEHTFQTLKDIICTSPVLIHPDPEEKFQVETDVSNYAYSAILSQKSKKDHKHHPITFFSKSMNPAEQNYRISDKEALAIVKALQHWHHWLEGTKIPVDILTDHQNLQYFTRPWVLNC